MLKLVAATKTGKPVLAKKELVVKEQQKQKRLSKQNKRSLYKSEAH
jgi:hypothetical protein